MAGQVPPSMQGCFHPSGGRLADSATQAGRGIVEEAAYDPMEPPFDFDSRAACAVTGFEGDFYPEGPTFRGVVLGCSGDVPLGGATHDMWPPAGALSPGFYDDIGTGCGTWKDAPEHWATDADVLSFGSGLCDSIRARPRPVPDDPLFALDSTTVHVALREHRQPERIIAACTDFFQNRCSGACSIATDTDFSMKVVLLSDAGDCTIRVTLYEESGSAFALEFHRCRGDSVAFHQAFGDAVRFLQWQPQIGQVSYRGHLAGEGEWSVPRPPADAVGFDLDVCQPLLAGVLPLTEVARSWASIIRSSAAAAEMSRNGQLVHHIQELLLSDKLEVHLAAAHLLRHMTHHDDTLEWFPAGGIQPGMFAKLVTEAHCDTVREELWCLLERGGQRV